MTLMFSLMMTAHKPDVIWLDEIAEALKNCAEGLNSYMLMYLKYENPNSREYGRVVIETENTDQIGDGWNYLQWRGKARSHDAIMNLALKTVCRCNFDRENRIC